GQARRAGPQRRTPPSTRPPARSPPSLDRSTRALHGTAPLDRGRPRPQPPPKHVSDHPAVGKAPRDVPSPGEAEPPASGAFIRSVRSGLLVAELDEILHTSQNRNDQS